MMAATHRLGGLAAGMALTVLLDAEPVYGAVLTGCAVLGSLLPDIDNRHSAISRKWRPAGYAVAFGQGMIRFMSNLFPAKQRRYIRSLVGHRGLTHSLVPLILIPSAASGIGLAAGNPVYGCFAAAGLGAGILSHLLFDMLAGGVPLLMPFSTRRITLAHMKTGGAAEWIFRMTLITLFLYFGYEEVLSWLGSLHL